MLEDVAADGSQINIFAIGACDLYHAIAHFSMPNQKFIYECNVYHGKERGVNVGTEYIRSHFEMNEEEKNFCREHFLNYRGSLCFHSKIFAEAYDYMIMSFHDDMIYQIYENRVNKNIRVLRSPAPVFGDTSVAFGNRNIGKAEQEKWMSENFTEGRYISEDRFYENLMWIRDHAAEETKIILITGPELDFFRKNHPHCPQVREQIMRLNRVLFRVQEEFPDRFAVADINRCIRSLNDVTDYVFHLKAQTAYQLFVEIVWTILKKFGPGKQPVLSKVRGNRKVVIYGNGIQARNAFYNLKLCGENPVKYVHFDWKDKKVGTMQVASGDILENNKDKFYVAVADEGNYGKIAASLTDMSYRAGEDFVRIKPVEYRKCWKESAE